MAFYNITFTLNGNFLGNMFVVENMMFCEVVYHFCKNFSLKENEASFFFNSKEIKSDSTRKLKALGIKNMSVIEVKIKSPIKYQMYSNFGNMGMNPYFYMGQQNYENKNDILYHSTNKDKDTSDFLIVIFYFQGKYIPVQATKYTKFSELSTILCAKAGIEEDKHLRYLINSHLFRPDDYRTLSDLNIKDQTRIEALFTGEEIG